MGPWRWCCRPPRCGPCCPHKPAEVTVSKSPEGEGGGLTGRAWARDVWAAATLPSPSFSSHFWPIQDTLEASPPPAELMA
jgi:hypothetical protein